MCLRCHVVRRQEIRITGDKGIQVTDDGIPLLELHLDQTALVTHFRLVGIQTDGRIKILQGTVIIAYLLSHHTSVIVTVCIPRGEFDSLIVIAQCTAVVMAMIMDDTAVDIIACPFRAQIDGLSELDIRIIFLSAHEVGHTQCRPYGRVEFIVLGSLFETLHGAECILFEDTYTSFLGPNRRRLRFTLQHHLDVLEGFVVAFLFGAYIGAQEGISAVLRRETQCLGVIGFRFVVQA